MRSTLTFENPNYYGRFVALVPCYNGEKFLQSSILSLIDQSTPLDSIIVIDDGSSDHSRTLIESLSADHPSVKGIFNDTNRGRAVCLNECFDHISAKYFFLQDADDVAHPNRIERQLAYMTANPEMGCSSNFVRYINSKGEFLGNGILDLTNQGRLAAYLASNEPFGLFCPAAVLRGSVMRDSSLRFRQQFWPADDIDLWNRIAEAGWQVLAQPEYLVDYRIHGSSAVTSSFMATREKYEFVRACLRARRTGRDEPSWEQFQEMRSARSPLIKLNDWRKASAKGLYRNAGFRWGSGERLRAIGSLATAAILQPGYVLPRLRKQFS